MHSPLDPPDLSIEATLEGPVGKRKTIWMAVDTGSSFSVVPQTLLGDLGVGEAGTVTLDALGRPALFHVGVVPRVSLGELTIERLVVGGGAMPPNVRDHGVLGGSTLYQAPWEISWDRGTVTFNATPWPPEANVWSLPLLPTKDQTIEIEVGLNNVPVRMFVDTGATFSTVERRVAEQLGLPAASAGPSGLTGLGGSLPTTGRVVLADLQLGSRTLEGQVFAEVDTDHPLLGLSALAAYDLQILPRRISFKPRNPDMRATAAERIGRWPWMPACPDPGCVRGYVEGSSDAARIVFEFEAEFPRPVEIVFGCAESAEPDWLKPWGLRTDLGTPYRHVRLEIDEARVENEENVRPIAADSLAVANIDEQLLLPNGRPCRDLRPLDVSPVRDVGLPANGRRVTFLP